jgi:radial spoke head protein 4A
VTNPFFNKSEKFYLRAQIARIAQSTTLVPKGVYRLDEDTKEIVENLPEEGPVPIPSTSQMGKLDFWVHYQRSILKCNRLTIMEPEIIEDLDPELARKEAEMSDP